MNTQRRCTFDCWEHAILSNSDQPISNQRPSTRFPSVQSIWAYSNQLVFRVPRRLPAPLTTICEEALYVLSMRDGYEPALTSHYGLAFRSIDAFHQTKTLKPGLDD